MKIPFRRWAPFLMALAMLTLLASPAAGMPLIDAYTTSADAYGASKQDAPKTLLITYSTPEAHVIFLKSPTVTAPLQMVAPGTNASSVVIYVEEPMDGGNSLFIWKDTENDGFLMDNQVVVTMKKPTDVAEGESMYGFLMTDEREITGIIITKINGLFVFNDRESGLILWQGHPNKFIIGL